MVIRIKCPAGISKKIRPMYIKPELTSTVWNSAYHLKIQMFSFRKLTIPSIIRKISFQTMQVSIAIQRYEINFPLSLCIWSQCPATSIFSVLDYEHYWFKATSQQPVEMKWQYILYFGFAMSRTFPLSNMKSSLSMNWQAALKDGHTLWIPDTKKDQWLRTAP